MPRLIQNPGRPDERVYELKAGRITTLGRTLENDIFVRHESLSRAHAEIDARDGRFEVVDLQSKNGTFVNGKRIERREVRAGDIIKLGAVELAFAADVESSREPTFLFSVESDRPDPISSLLGSDVQRSGALRVRSAKAGERAHDKLQLLLKVSELLASPDGVDALLRRILELLYEILEVDRGAILMVEPGTQKLEPRMVRVARGQDEGRPFYSEHIVEHVRKTGAAALFSDAAIDPRLGSAPSVLNQSIRASMCAPLKAGNDVIGVIYVDSQSLANHFLQEDLEFLNAFASQASIALENSRLHRRIEEEAVTRNTLVRFFSPATITRLIESGAALHVVTEAEVTALFADISNFTAMSSEMQPREVLELLNEYFPAMTDVVFKQEGTLEKYIGDAMMAIWGAPFSHDDDADRALRAAVDMQLALRDLNREWAVRRKREIHIHVGLNTGTVAVGNIGSDRYLQYAAVGDATNVASRVCGVAAQGEILITESTLAKLCNRSIRIEKLEPVTVKGKEQALQLYRVGWEKM